MTDKEVIEIEKMYENAGIKPYIYCSKPQLDCDARETGNCRQDCEYYSGKRLLLPFTAEKVIRLLEWEANRGIIDIKHSLKGYQIFTYIHTGNYGKSIIDAVASYFCVKWQDLTEEEKQQVKGILE